MKQLLAVGVVAFAMASSFGADYYYKGGNLPWTEPSSYTVGKEDATELPGASDFIVLSANKTAFVDDDSIAFFSRVNRVFLYGENITFTIDITTNATFGCWLGDQGGHAYTNTWVVKKGAGELFFSRPYDSKSTSYSYDASIDVQEGAYHAAPTVGGATKHQFEHVRVAEGATFYGVTNNTTVINSLAGAGVVTNDSPIVYRNSNFSFQINSGNNIAEPTEFSGQIFGEWIVYFASYVNFTGTGSAVKELQVAGYDGGNKGRLGITSLASAVESPLGRTGFECRGSVRTVYLGEPGGTSVASYTLWDTGSAPVTIDAGEKGGWLLTGGTFTVRDAMAKQQRIELTGEDTAEPCALSNTVEALKDGSASVYLTKSGSGTWKIYDNGSTELSGAIAVKDGTLEFNTLAEQGQRCALGTATCLYEDKCAAPANLQTVPYSWLLGTEGDVSKVGTLSYLGDEDFQLESRKTSLAGAGRLRTKAGSLLKYSAGVTGCGAGEKEIRFENGAGATNVVSGVSDGTDGATVSVVKEGAGACTLTGDLGFTGDLVVKAGELTLKDINGAKYRWYRYKFKANVASSTNAAHAAWTVNTSVYSTGIYSRSIRAAALPFYDASGTRIETYDCGDASYLGSSYLTLEPRQAQLVGADELAFMSNKYNSDFGVRRLFANSISSGAVFDAHWQDNLKWPKEDDPSSWIVAYRRLSDDAAEPRFWDLCYTDKTTSSYFPGCVTALSIDASADGATWQEVASTNNICFFPTNTFAWISNPIEAGWESTGTKPDSVEHPNKFPLAASRQQGTYARPVPRSVGVASGAKLTVEGALVTASGVTLGADGFGTVSGVKLAESGTVDLVCDLSEKPKRVFFPADFSQFGDSADNVLGYGVTVNGGAVPRAYEASVTPNGVTLLRKGALLIIR